MYILYELFQIYGIHVTIKLFRGHYIWYHDEILAILNNFLIRFLHGLKNYRY
jgi:hypothetical protein